MIWNNQIPSTKKYSDSNQRIPKIFFVWVGEHLVKEIYLEFVIWALDFFVPHGLSQTSVY
ncbi:MAG: hypothetical protein A2156_04480 [Deltaproteobacteria bacterium RBG_16_48_10]|nr:MAG: hypothetical protein A2156_04480 [Deltaproteobacteria bacterium RBG_16_48_10]